MKKIVSLFLAMAAASVTCAAQTLQSEYFLDNNLYSYRLNPAMQGDRNFMGLFLNDIGMSTASSLGINSIIYNNPDGSGLVTGLNKAISSEEFLSGFESANDFNFEFGESLVALGFHSKNNGFSTVEINLRTLASAGIPGDFFAFLKNGSRETPYDCSSMHLNAQVVAEVSYGFSTSIGDRFTVGGRAKFLAGLASFNATCPKADLTVNAQNLAYNLEMNFEAAANFLKIGTKPSAVDPSVGVMDFDHISFGDPLPGGYGAALDLGLTFKPIEGLTLSLSALDLGGIRWKYNIVGSTESSEQFKGINLESLSDLARVSEDLDQIMDLIPDVFEFKPDQSRRDAASFEMLPVIINLGAKYKMPFYGRMSAGILGTYRTDSRYEFWDVRTGIAVTPVDWFGISANYGFNSYGLTWGTAFSLTAACFNLHIALDSYSGHTGKFITAESRNLRFPLGPFKCQMNLGLTVTF